MTALKIPMRSRATRHILWKRRWTLIASWAVFWLLSALAPFCSGWAAAIGAASSHAAHHAVTVSADDDHEPAQDKEQCCQTDVEASALESKSELASSIEGELRPCAIVARSIVTLVSTCDRSYRVEPPSWPPRQVFQDTRRLRI